MDITTLDAVKVAEMKPPEVRELFQRYVKLTEKVLDVIREVDEIVRELGVDDHPGWLVYVSDGSLVV